MKSVLINIRKTFNNVENWFFRRYAKWKFPMLDFSLTEADIIRTKELIKQGIIKEDENINF